VRREAATGWGAAAASETTLAEGIDGAAVGVAVWSAEGVPVYANPAHAALAAAVAGGSIGSGARIGGDETTELRGRDGRAVLRKRRRLASGGRIETLTDVTLHRRREAELEAARARADAAMAARSQFIAVMSHELRTPLNGVLGFAGLLGMSDLDHRQRRWLAHLVESGEVLLRVLNGILDLTALEAGGLVLEPRPFDPAAAARAAAAQHLTAASEKRLAIDVEAAPGLPATALGDPRRVEQALSLLVENAVKFTDAGCVRVTVSTEAGGRDGPRLRYEVADTGPGFAPEALGRLFDPFVQADGSATRRHGGVGIGLALCRRLAEAMGGALAVDSAPGAGARATLRLPLGPGPG
jgi:signal transduction histidine kinase